MFNTLTRMGASGAGGDYEIERSLRCNKPDTSFLNRTPSSTTNRRTFTFSVWVKSSLSNEDWDGAIFGVWQDNTSRDVLRFMDGVINLQCGQHSENASTTAVFRDPSAWYHIVCAVDSTQAASADRVVIYVNNVSQGLGTNTISQDRDFKINTDNLHVIGCRWLSGSYNSGFNGYLAEFNFIDGSKLTPSSFGKTDTITGQWVPKKYGGSYGTNGYYLNFSDNSGTTATTLGKDSSGNGNNWTPNNFSILTGPNNDSLIDTPTNNYATFNPLGTGDSCTYKNGDITVVCNNASTSGTTIAVSSGKWYVEIIPTAKSAVNPMVGVCYAEGFDGERQINESLNGGKGYGYIANGNKALPDGSNPSYGASYAIDDNIGIALDLDSAQNTVTFYKNGSSQGSIDIDSGTYVFGCSNGQSSSTIEYDIITGQRPFTHTPPTGFQALCTDNLPDPTIVKPTDYFNNVLYSGTGSSNSITGFDFSPNMIIAKRRNTAGHSHLLIDTIRGGNTSFQTETNGADNTNANRSMTFISNGVTWNSDTGNANGSGGTYLLNAWKESATAGFDMVGYAGDHNDGRTVAHSLGVIPEMIIVKRRTNTDPFVVYHKAMAGDEYVKLDTDNGKASVSNYWDASGTRPTSSVFSVGDNNGTNGSTQTYMAYLWASVEGFSKVGSYEGIGGTDGPFIYTGFKPSYVLIKNIDSDSRWWVQKTAKQLGYNPQNEALFPNTDNAETSESTLDILSNGFKIRNNGSYTNENNSTHIYLAFAESPFKYANAR